MTSTTIQPFRKKHHINIDSFDGSRLNPRKITERNIALSLYKNCFCLIWKSQNVSFNKAIQETEINFKVVNTFISDGHGKVFSNMKIILKKFNLS